MSRQLVQRLLLTGLMAYLAGSSAVYALLQSTGPVAQAMGVAAVALTLVAAIACAWRFWPYPFPRYLRAMYLAFLPGMVLGMLAPVEGAFPGAGLLGLLWSVGIGILFVANSRYIDWVLAEESGS